MNAFILKLIGNFSIFIRLISNFMEIVEPLLVLTIVTTLITICIASVQIEMASTQV